MCDEYDWFTQEDIGSLLTVYVRATAKDQFQDLTGRDYILARGLDKVRSARADVCTALPKKGKRMSAPASPIAVAAAGQGLRDAASSALELLELSGLGACDGNTADDLRLAIKSYEHAAQHFVVTVRNSTGTTQFYTEVTSSANAFIQVADAQGENPSSISVTPARALAAMPGRAALERAHQALRSTMPLDEMLKHPALAKTLSIVAMQKPRKKRALRFDWRKAQANDLD